MSIGTPNGILDITGATLRVSKMEFRQSTGFDTVLNNVARNTMLLMDETEQTTSNSWALKLPNAWVAEFHGYWASGSSGAPILFNFYNDSTSGTNGYTLSMNDTTISINYDGGSTLGSATLSSTLNNDAYRKVAIIFERSVLDVSVDGEHVFHFADSQLRDRVYDNNSGYVTFTHSSTDERKLKNLKFTNGDKWVREIDSSNIAYVGGNVGIGTTIPGTKLDVSGTVRGTHLMGDGSAISAIQSSNVSDFGSNVTRIGTLETDLGDNSSRITNLSSNLSDNSSRITALESGDISISGDKTFTGDIIFESNVHMNSGNVFVANTVNLTVSDPIIELGSNNSGTNDLGIIMTRPNNNSNVAVVFDESVDILRMGYTLNGANDTVVDLDSNALAVSVQGALTAGSNLEVGTANLFVDTTTSRVGIGMSNPSYTLDVDGDINLSTGSTLKINGTDAVFSRWTASGSDIYRSSGNVGIGTASPAAVLDVFSSPHVTGYREMAHFRVSNTSDDSDFTRLIFGQVATNKMFLETTNEANTKGDLLLQPYGGNVGIGTTSPDAIFHKHSNAGADEVWVDKWKHSFDGHWNFRLSQRHDSGVSVEYGFKQRYNGVEYSPITFRGSTMELSGNVGIGTTSPIAALDINRGAENNTTPALSIRGGLYDPSDLYVLNTYNVNTGVGFAAKVIGVNIKNKVESNNTVQLRNNVGGLTSAGAIYLGSDDINQGIFGVLGADGTAGTTLSEHLTVRAGGNVGIGTASPGIVLDVGSSLSNPQIGRNYATGSVHDADKRDAIYFGRWDGTGRDFLGIKCRVDTHTALGYGDYSNQTKLEFYTWGNNYASSREVMCIRGDGNVGIGTSSPSYNLDVNGSFGAKNKGWYITEQTPIKIILLIM
jgi:hypothetical protein